MAYPSKLCSGTFSDSNSTLYTVDSTNGVVVQSIVICNTTASAVTVTLKLDGVEIVGGKSLAANDSLIIPTFHAILADTKLIEGSASVAAGVKYYISGIAV